MKVLPITNEAGAFVFECPGCKCSHKVNTGPANSLGAVWSYNGNPDKPTFSPSLLIRSGHYIPGEESKRCWCNYHREHPEEKWAPKCSICHSFVTDGKIQFLSDCTHELAGQTVELPEL